MNEPKKQPAKSKKVVFISAALVLLAALGVGIARTESDEPLPSKPLPSKSLPSESPTAGVAKPVDKATLFWGNMLWGSSEPTAAAGPSGSAEQPAVTPWDSTPSNTPDPGPGYTPAWEVDVPPRENLVPPPAVTGNWRPEKP